MKTAKLIETFRDPISYMHEDILTDTSLIMYMCNLAEQSNKMNEITSIVDKCEVGSWLDGKKLAEEIGLPTTVVKSIFSIYEANGYGYLSKEIGACMYIGQA